MKWKLFTIVAIVVCGLMVLIVSYSVKERQSSPRVNSASLIAIGEESKATSRNGVSRHLDTISEPKGKQKSKPKEPKRRFPNAIIIGVKKGGTRALIEMLSTHPQIAVTHREMQFFSRNYDKGIDWYINEMPKATDDKIVMEKSPSYFDYVSADVPKRIYSHSTNVKLILIVRNPIDRAVSDYVHYLDENYTGGRHPPKFEEMVIVNGSIPQKTQRRFIEKSMYDVHYARWRTYFNDSQLLVLNGGRLSNNPLPVLKKVERFLGVSSFFQKKMFFYNKEKGFYCWNMHTSASRETCLGSSKGRPHPVLSETTMGILRRFFKPHMEQFCSAASVHFSWCHLE